ncbi:gliding motility lipoprotein GldD [Cellulophaga sp. HaHaR_3_176]|uniref:gliding motility lipoprotein GldD n=1 Tax=Cellulophaga sp. HaHaR_3_176 TaxID=1942464 RepID=UPI001C1FC3D4|nr:gliding motility lipoprotein GldD [Cellulophaga sp. HaHaR_3_176]QWX83293.1 gliding motility lipoprotein GldD [Cellulophaga sp. HaHaR_3_176]
MNCKSAVVLFLFGFLLVSCEDENVMPKPKAMLRLEYPMAKEAELNVGELTFNYNEQAKPVIKNKNAIIIDYPGMKGAIFITYKKIDDNLKNLITDAEKLSLEHMKKADKIEPRTFINEDNKVYGTYFQIIGDAASQSQFYLTDSINHFVTGSVYFYRKPNYDSILPAADYLQSDMRTIMETLRWSSEE